MNLELRENIAPGKFLRGAKTIIKNVELMEFSIECIMGRNWKTACKFKVEVPENFSLTDLHYLIQEVMRFDNDHMYEFYAGRNYRNRKVRFGEEEDRDYDMDSLNYILLKDIYPLPKSCKLYYVFDFGDSWIFEIRKSRKILKTIQNKKYPFLLGIEGKIPEQYPDTDY